MHRFARFLVLGVFGAWSLSATLLTSQPGGGTTTTFPGGNTCNGGAIGPVSFAGFLVSTDGASCFPYGDASDQWGFVANGTWDMGLIGDESASTLITIDLGGLYSQVGGFVNYEPGAGTPVIRAIAADGTTVLESWDLSASAPISTGAGSVDDGAFRGIDRGVAEIRYFQFGGSYMAMHDITLGEVPEPSTAVLAAGAFALLGLLRRRRR